MDKKLFIDLVISQVNTVRINAELTDPTSTDVFTALDSVMKTLETLKSGPTTAFFVDRGDRNNVNLDYAPYDYEDDDEPRERKIPEGMTEESFETFIKDYFDEYEAEDIIAEGTVEVSGYLPNEKGEYVEVGNFADSAEKAEEILAQIEEDRGEPVTTDNLITVKYSRLDGSELTEEETQTIIDHPISDSLKKLGTVYLLAVNPTDDPASKEAVFVVDDEQQSILKMLALNIVSYRGVHVFPGLGRIQAVGSVNFA